MREIKFRAWDKKDKKMFTMKNVNGDLGLYFNYTTRTYEEGTEFVSRFIQMQYTGLKDKNGKEIYEGDVIIKRPLLITGEYSIPNFIGVVGFSECSFWVERKNTANLLYLECEEVEILGNIYENPELMEVGNE